MIESGSCCALLASELVSAKQNVTIITNSAFIADYIRKSPYAKIILLGGEHQNESQVMVGPIVRSCVQNFMVDKLFIGTDGFHPGLGFTGNDYARADTVRNMTMQAKHACVITESHKFSRQGVVSLMSLWEINAVITDDKIPAEQLESLKQNGVSKKSGWNLLRSISEHKYSPLLIISS